jgi:molecular chaperone DnaK
MIQWLELAERALLKEHVPSADTVPPRRDVSSHSLGVVVDGKNKILLPRNTPIPCEAKHLVFTDADGQTDLTLRVTEGEDEDLEYVTIALEAPLKIPAYRRAAPFEVAFQYDTNGVVRITVLDLTTRKSLGEVQLVRKGTLAEEQVKSGVVELGKETVN